MDSEKALNQSFSICLLTETGLKEQRQIYIPFFISLVYSWNMAVINNCLNE